MEVLDYVEMLDLSRLFQQWALEEKNITSDQRTKLMLDSADYEAIANFVGSSWRCTLIESPIDVLKFIARNAFPSITARPRLLVTNIVDFHSCLKPKNGVLLEEFRH